MKLIIFFIAVANAVFFMVISAIRDDWVMRAAAQPWLAALFVMAFILNVMKERDK